MFTAVQNYSVPAIFADTQELKSESEREGREREREKQLSAAAAFVKVNDEHQKPQTRERKNKQVVNQCCRIKSLGRDARPVSVCVCVWNITLVGLL